MKESNATYKYIYASVAVTAGTAYWRKYYTAEEQRTKRRVRECEDSKTELLNETETRQVEKTKVVETYVWVVCQGGNVEHGDQAFTTHPGTGETVPLSRN